MPSAQTTTKDKEDTTHDLHKRRGDDMADHQTARNLIGIFFLRLFSRRKSALPPVDKQTPFHAGTIPNESGSTAPVAYFNRIVKYGQVSSTVMLAAIVLMHRAWRGRYIDLHCYHRLMLTSILVAAKLNDDDCYSNGFYAKIGGLRLAELNALEIQFCYNLLNYNTYIGDAEYMRVRAQLVMTSNGMFAPVITMAWHDEALRYTKQAAQEIKDLAIDTSVTVVEKRRVTFREPLTQVFEHTLKAVDLLCYEVDDEPKPELKSLPLARKATLPLMSEDTKRQRPNNPNSTALRSVELAETFEACHQRPSVSPPSLLSSYKMKPEKQCGRKYGQPMRLLVGPVSER